MEILDERADLLRLEGNQLYRAKNFNEAISKYSEAIAIDSSCHTVWSNRSAAFLALGNFENASSDARKAIELNNSFVKSYYRLAAALAGLNLNIEAEGVALQGLKLEPNNIQLKTFLQKKPTPTVFKPKFGVIYGDKAESVGHFSDDSSSPEEDPQRKRLKREIKGILKNLLDKIDSKVPLNPQNSMLQGTYSKLMDSTTFCDVVYPGMDESKLRGVPKNVYELLHPNYIVRVELLARFPNIIESALAVFEGVRRRGAERGDTMDAATEAVLLPQISGESFALAVVNIVKSLNQRASAAYAELCLTVAAPSDVKAERDQLDLEIVRGIAAAGVGVQDEYLGQEWSDLIWADLRRYAETEKMSPSTNVISPVLASAVSSGLSRISWIELDSIKETYPALAEAVECLHALPFELNGKLQNLQAIDHLNDTMMLPQLLVPCRGSTCLTHVLCGVSDFGRVDNRGGAQDSGIRLSCSYYIVPTSKSNAGKVKMSLVDKSKSSTELELDVLNDRLIIHRSLDYRTMISETTKDYFVLSFYIYGAMKPTSKIP